MSQRKTQNGFRGVLLCCALVLQGAPGAAIAAAREVIVIFDLPAEAREPEVLSRAAASLAAALPPGSRLGAVSSDGQNARLITALADPRAAGEAIESAAREMMTAADKDPAAALERALYELRIDGRDGVLPAVVMVSDGRTQMPGDEAAERRAWMLGPLTAEAQRNHAPVYVIAVSTAADMAVLQPLARATGADYFRAESASRIPEMMAQAGAALAEADLPAATAAERAQAESPPAVDTARPSAAPPAMALPVADVAVVHPAPTADALAGQVLAGVVGAAVALAAVAATTVARRRRKAPPGPEPQAPQEPGAVQQVKAASAVAPAAFLNDLRGTTQFSRYALGTRPVVIGRSPGRDTRNFDYITATLNTVSRRHAVIEFRDGAYWVIDQGSVNGTRVNGQRIQGARRLCHGDRIALHRCELQFEFAEARGELSMAAAGDGHTPTQAMATQPGRRAAILSETLIVPAARAPGQSTPKAAKIAPGAASGNGDVRTVAADEDGAATSLTAVSGAAAAPSAGAVAGALDSFISTTLLRAETNEQSPSPPGSPAKSAEPVHLFATLDTGPREMSIEDFLGSDNLAEDPAMAPPPALLATQPLTESRSPAPDNGGRYGDTIKLALDGAAQPDATTASLEELLRAFEQQKGPEEPSQSRFPTVGGGSGTGHES